MQLLSEWKNLVTFSFHLTWERTVKDGLTDILVNIISHFLYHQFYNSLSCPSFQISMQDAEVTPIHKKNDKTDKANYRPKSILPKLR